MWFVSPTTAVSGPSVHTQPTPHPQKKIPISIGRCQQGHKTFRKKLLIAGMGKCNI